MKKDGAKLTQIQKQQEYRRPLLEAPRRLLVQQGGSIQRGSSTCCGLGKEIINPWACLGRGVGAGMTEEENKQKKSWHLPEKKLGKRK